jgi:transposase
MAGGQGKMRLIRLAGRARHTLERIAHSAANARMVRRAQALLWLHAGERVGMVAQRLGMSRRGIYKIAAQYQTRADQPVAQRIADGPHTGRRATKREQVAQMVARLLKTKPSRYGYRALAWSTPMLRHQVEQRLQMSVSDRTVRRALRQLRYRYKRPRYVLARRSVTWRQAKGGSKTA